MKSPVARLVVWSIGLLACLVGMYVSMHLALLHYRTAKANENLLDDICTAFPGSSCEKVAQSRWSWFPPLPDPDAAVSEPAASSDDEAADPQSAEAGAETDDDGDDGAEDLKSGSKSGAQGSQAIPTAQLGLMFFSVVLCWIAFMGPARPTRAGPHVALLVVTGLGLLGSAFFEYVMWTQLEAWCPLCVIAHAASLVLVPVAALLLVGRREGHDGDGEAPPAETGSPAATGETEGLFAPAPRTWNPRARSANPAVDASFSQQPSTRMLVIAGISAFLLVGLEHQYLQKKAVQMKVESAKYMQDFYQKKWMKYERHWQHNFLAWQLTPPVDIPVEGRPVRGPADANHTIVVFSDFGCPACAKFEKYLRDVVLKLGQRVAGGKGFNLIFKHWPICKDCNEVMEGRTLHPAACEASYAAEAARIVGGDEAFWKMHDLLFDNQKDWRKSRDFVPYARKIGLDEEAFKKAMGSAEALDRVRADILDGDALGSEFDNPKRQAEIKVTSTPTVFVDGKRFDSPTKGRAWSQIARMPPPPAAKQAAPAAGPVDRQ